MDQFNLVRLFGVLSAKYIDVKIALISAFCQEIFHCNSMQIKICQSILV